MAPLEVGQRIPAAATKLTPEWVKTAELYEVFVVVNVVHEHHSSHISGDVIAAIVGRLLAAEQAPGGPYISSNGTIEFATNAAIVVFASWAAGELPGTLQYLKQYLRDARVGSLNQQELLAAQSIAALKMELTPHLKDRPTIEQPAKSSHRQKTSRQQSRHNKDNDAAILDQVDAEVQALPEALQTMARSMVKSIAAANKNYEITLLSTFFATAIKVQTLSTQLPIVLGRANLYCWLAYTIFDDIFDDGSNMQLLPIATWALRRTLRLYREASSIEFAAYCEQVFNAMDNANAWEITHARFAVHDGTISIQALPDFTDQGQLAARSFAHCLGPIILAGQAGYDLQSKQSQALQAAFRHYLIARQINDDIHDWRQDIRSGQITYVVTAILAETEIAPGQYQLGKLIQRMEHQFHRKIVGKICNIIDEHIQQATQLLEQSGLVVPDNQITELFASIRMSVQTTRLRHADGLAFSSAFKPKNI